MGTRRIRMKRQPLSELGRLLQQRIDQPGVAHPIERAAWELEPAGSSESDIFGTSSWPAELRQRNRYRGLEPA